MIHTFGQWPAFAIATPIASYFMPQWLQDYVYRINISWLFAAGGLIAIIIAFATISFPGNKSSNGKPGEVASYGVTERSSYNKLIEITIMSK